MAMTLLSWFSCESSQVAWSVRQHVHAKLTDRMAEQIDCASMLRPLSQAQEVKM